MAAWLLRRIAFVGLSAFTSMTLVFWLNVLIPADAATASLSQSAGGTDVVERRRAELGLDQPPLEQYADYVSSLAQFDLGRSWATGQSVAALIKTQLLPTVSLAVTSLAVATALGLAGGLLSYVNGWSARGLNFISALSLSVPIIFSGTVAIWLFAIRLDWFPATGQGRGAQLVLPAMVLGINGAGSIYKVVQDSISDSLSAQWVRAARARGLSPVRLWVRHILRPSLLPVLNIVGLQFGYLLGGVAVIENLFSRSGMGRILVMGVLNKDLPVVLAVVLMVAIGYGCINLIVDGLYLGLDPRLRSSMNG